MEISIGSYKVRIEIVLAIVVLFWIIFGHLLCSCCRVSLFEGATAMSSSMRSALKKVKKEEVDKAEREVNKLQKELDNARSKLINLKVNL
jgi:hypothetical protein